MAVLVDARSKLVQLKRYKLCGHCIERHADSRIKPDRQQCYICRDLMEDLDSITARLKSAVKRYEFDTFLIGATLPMQIYEREDAMRARLKIRGRESIKSQLTRELGTRLARITRKKVEYLKPDVTINLTIDKDNGIDVAVKSRPLALAGRYVKKTRGLLQRQDRCPHCEGRGCKSCSYSGLAGHGSVEGIIAKEVMARTKGQTPRFSWIGSEDQSSLVLGKGRPFYVRVSNPQKRKLKRFRVKGDGVEATMSVQNVPETQPRFIVKTRIHARCEKALTRRDMDKLGSLSGADVSFENRSKIATKKVYSACAKRVGSNEFTLTITADGGLMIKQFVGGEQYMQPNISGILGAKCECVTFDILDVQVQ